MKKSFILCLFLSICFLVSAQQRGYECRYLQQMDVSSLHFGGENPELKELIQQTLKEHRTYCTLKFQDGKMLFEPEKSSAQGPREESIPTIYMDMNTQEQIKQQDFFGKKFLITDTVRPINWTIADETKEINGHICRKATFKTDDLPEEFKKDFKDNPEVTDIVESMITAWFDPQIPIPAGPMGFAFLPGLIVQLDMKIISYTLEEVKTSDNLDIQKPKKGKKVTEQEFREIQEKKTENFRGGHFDFDSMGGNSNVIIIGR